MATDVYQAMLINDGEGISDVDLNDIGKFQNSRLFDQLVRNKHVMDPTNEPGGSPSMQTAAGPSRPHCYALSGGAGYVVPGPGALQTTVRKGTILQSLGEPNGAESQLLPFSFTNAPFTLTHAVGDATNPRVDIIQAKLEYVDGDAESRNFESAVSRAKSSVSLSKRRRIQGTFSIKQGTPAAAPQYPSMDAGYVALGAVLVPATHNAVFTALAHIRDLRVPIGVRSVDVFPNDFVHDNGGWSYSQSTTLGTFLQRFNLPASTDATMAIPCPLGPRARIIGFGVYGRFLAATARECKLFRQRIVDPASQTTYPETTINTELADISTQFSFGVSSNQWRWAFATMNDIESWMDSGPSPTRSAQGIGDGLWGNGLYCGPSIEHEAEQAFGAAQFNRLFAKIRLSTGGGEQAAVLFARWLYSEGF